MGNDFRRGIRVYLETSDYSKGISELVNQNQKLNTEYEQLKNKAEALSTAEQKRLKQLKTQLEKNAQTEVSYKQKLKETEAVLNNLSGSSYNDLIKVQNRLQKEVKETVRGTQEHTTKLEQYNRVTKEVTVAKKEMNLVVGAEGNAFSRATGFVNKYWAMLGAGIATITGLSFTFRKLGEDVAKMDDVYSDVMKTTGMTRDEVLELNEAFKKMDTRTSREDLNKIAEAGGRIGVAKEDIIDFTEAMNIANVALGDSFTGGVEEISTKLGKLKNLFSETKDMQIEKAYLSIASSINELGANGAASEQNISEFALRIGSLPEALKPSVAETLALGAAFEESGIEAEISGRAYNIFLKQASTESGKFAQVMGISAKEVENLINTNPMDFFLKFAEGMRGMDATEVAKTLDYLGVNADGANKAIGAAANSTDRFRELITLSNKAFTEGTSVINEYNIKNNNLAAQLDKARKNFKEVSLELGERLSPALLKSTNATSYLIKALVELPKWINQNKLIIIALTAIWGVQTAAIYASIVADKLKAFWTDKVVISVKKLGAAIKANPWGLIATGVVLGLVWLNKYLNKQNEVNKSQEHFLNLAQKTSDFFAQQQDLQQRFNSKGSLSKSQLESLSSDLSNQLSEIEKIDAELKAKAKHVIETDHTLQQLNAEYNKGNKYTKLKLLTSIKWREDELLGGYAEEFSKTNTMLKELKKNKQEVDKLIASKPDTTTYTPTSDPTSDSSSTKNKWDAEIDKAEEVYKIELLMYSMMLKDKLISQENYEIISLQRENNFLKEKQTILEKYKQSSIDVQQAIVNNETKIQEKNKKIDTPAIKALKIDQDALNAGLQAYVKNIQDKKKAEYEFAQWKKEARKKDLQDTIAIAEYAVNAVNAYHQMEADSLEAEKQRELTAAGDNAEAREAIEKKYAQKELDLKKKQANADMIVKIASTIASTAQAIMQAFAQLGPVAAPIAAALIGATGAMQIASIVEQRNAIMATTLDGSSSSSSASTSTPRVANSTIKTPQAAEGRWDVVGASDGRTYRNVPYRGVARTGIYRSPVLVAERGDELIVDNPTLRNIRMDAPHLLNEINRYRVPQYADGRWNAMPQAGGSKSDLLVNTSTMDKLNALLEWYQTNRIEAYTVLSEFEAKRDLRDKSLKKGSLS